LKPVPIESIRAAAETKEGGVAGGGVIIIGGGIIGGGVGEAPVSFSHDKSVIQNTDAISLNQTDLLHLEYLKSFMRIFFNKD
jgi:hypothetical protein